MITAIRMDDITPDMDFVKFYKVKRILDKADLKPLIGVVPYNADETLHKEVPHENFGEMLKELKNQGWVIALHGYKHLYTTNKKGIFPINNFSEFAGVDYEVQLKMISEGVKKLGEWGVIPELFMAPGHTFDRKTIKALKENQIFAITDGFGTLPYKRGGMTFYPISKKRSECTSDKFGYSTYVLHTNTMTEADIEKFEKLINEKRKYFISYDRYLAVNADTRSMWGNIKEYLLALAKHYIVSRKASEGTVIHSINGELR